MTGRPFTVEAFDDATVGRSESDRGQLEHAASAATAEEPADDPDELLVLALRPDSEQRRVVASAGHTSIRAAVSVSIAAGNTRAWSDVIGPEHAAAGVSPTVALPLGRLPEIIRAAVEPAGFRSVWVAAVYDGSEIACLAMWLTRSPYPSYSDVAESRRAAILVRLHEAVVRQRVEDAQAAAEQAARQSARPQVVTVAPVVDVLASLPDRTEFDRRLAELRSDETGLIVFGIDAVEVYTEEALAIIARGVAERLHAHCRSKDVVARVGDDRFAVLLIDVDRRTAFEVSKRLRSVMSQPIGGPSPIDVSFSVGLAHEAGLVDAVELFASAESAMDDARHAGGARMLVAC